MRVNITGHAPTDGFIICRPEDVPPSVDVSVSFNPRHAAVALERFDETVASLRAQIVALTHADLS